MNVTEKPRYINNAVMLICLSPIIGIFKIVLDYDFVLSLGPIQSTMITMTLITLIMLFLVYKIWQGRNWARIVFFIFFVLGIYPAMLLMPAEAERSIAVVIGSILQTVSQFAAIILMYLPASNTWFKSIKDAKNA